MDKKIEKAARIIKAGGIVIFPTDTAFGIGCRIDNEKAVERLFKIRKRPLTQATPVLVDSIEMASDYVQNIPNAVKEQLVDKYWPGALTIILKSKNKISKMVQGGGNTLGIRMPNHKTTLSIIAGVGVPILGPSANFHGEKTPYTLEDLDRELIKMVDYVVPGECLIRDVSTVIDCSVKPWRILRKGAISIQNYNSRFKSRTILFIDTSSNQKIKVGLEISGKRFNKSKKIGHQKAQIVLPMIDKLLKEHNLKPSSLNAIKVNTRPGSFTGIRVGLAIANALSFALKIPRY